MAKSSGVERSEVIMRMREAIKKGVSASSFIRDMQKLGLSYRRTDMLADWRTQGDYQKKEGLLRYVRKDRVPTVQIVRGEAWKMSAEYMFNVRLKMQRSPGEPIEEKFVNIMSNTPLTIGQIEQAALELGSDRYVDAAQQIVSATAETAIQRIM